MNYLSASQRRLAAWAGILAPALFVGVFMLEGWLRPGYDPLGMFVSVLALGPRGWIQIANFIVFGLLLFVFSRVVAVEFQSGKASKAGPILLTILAFCFFISGPFVMDPMSTALEQATVHGTIHGIAGGIVFTLMPVSCFVFLRRFRVDPKWQSLQWWTLGLGTISAIGTILLTVVTKRPELTAVYLDWLGLIQRTALVPFMIWLFVFALAFLRSERSG